MSYYFDLGTSMSYYFPETYYLAAKLAQLKSVNEKDPYTGQFYTYEGLSQALREAGLTPQEHYELYGRHEGLNPNPFFNEVEYLQGKLRQLQSTEPQNNWTLEKLNAALGDAGLTPVEHYERYGAFETDARGNFINPSNALDAKTYYLAKLDMCRESGETVNGKSGGAITLEDVVHAFKAAELSPIEHFVRYGISEGSAIDGPFMMQHVPGVERVPSDPGREITGDIINKDWSYFPPYVDMAVAAGPDFTLERGSLLDAHITGTGGDDRFILEGSASIRGNIMGGDGNDNITINGTACSNILGGNGNDNIALGQTAKVAGVISGDGGADFINLGWNSSRLEIAIDMGDTGGYRIPHSSVFDASLCDVISGIGPNVELQLSGGWAADGTFFKASAFVPPVADNSACWITGNYNSATKAFTAAASGNDGLLVYDADAGVGVAAPQAVVLVGTDFTGATVIEGGLALNGLIAPGGIA